MDKEKTVIVWTVIPNDFELSTQHFETQSQAEGFARTYKDGATVVHNELPQRVVKLKENKTARFGYRI